MELWGSSPLFSFVGGGTKKKAGGGWTRGMWGGYSGGDSFFPPDMKGGVTDLGVARGGLRFPGFFTVSQKIFKPTPPHCPHTPPCPFGSCGPPTNNFCVEAGYKGGFTSGEQTKGGGAIRGAMAGMVGVGGGVGENHVFFFWGFKGPQKARPVVNRGGGPSTVQLFRRRRGGRLRGVGE